MFDNVLIESSIVQNNYTEYLQLVNKYKNIKRASVFCRYLNINLDASIYNPASDGTYDKYNSGLAFDIFDYTPLFYTSQIINEHSDNADLIGQQFQGMLNVISHSIEKPRVDDLIIYIYPPQDGGEIFRVISVRAVINAIQSTPELTWYELTLEYAPVIEPKKLNTLNHYVYNLVQEKYLLKTDFVKMIEDTQRMNELFTELKQTFDHDKELYYYTESDEQIFPLYENYLLYQFMSNNPGYLKYFTNAYLPFGIKKYGNTGCIDSDENEITCPDVEITNSTITNYAGTINIYDMSYLISQWQWSS